MSIQDEEIIAEFEEVAGAHADAPQVPENEDDIEDEDEDEDDSDED